jgi:hypothetical protein
VRLEIAQVLPFTISYDSAGMVEQLDVWSYGLPLPGQRATMAMLPTGLATVLAEGYLCTPQPALLAQIVERLIALPMIHQKCSGLLPDSP